MNRCPAAEDLVRLLEDRLDAAARARIEEHVEECPGCQQTLEQLAATDVSPLQQSGCAGPLDAESGTILARLQERPAPPLPSSRRSSDVSTLRGVGLDSDAPAALPPRVLPRVPGYDLLGVLGRGGMGVVYKARHLRLGRLVALKMIAGRGDADADYLARFRLEAEAVARLKHANIVQIYDVGDIPATENAGGGPYLALELLEGGNLAEATRYLPQPPADAARLLAVLARAMHHAHEQGVVHRDLKPSNIMFQSKLDLARCQKEFTSILAAFAAHSVVKVTDFGLAKRVDPEADATARAALTETGGILGSPGYLAPEQAAGQGAAVGPAADVYALGAILYDLLTGRPPFQGATPMETVWQTLSEEPVPPARLRPGVPRDLETICLHCLHKDPKRRYATAAALADDLERYLAGEPISARPVGRIERTVKWARRRPAAATLVALLVVGVFLGLGAAAWGWAQEQQARLDRKVQDAARLTRVLREFQHLYSEEVLERVKPMGVKISHDYTTEPGTVPLPPTLTLELARRLAAGGVCTIRIYSDQPFPWRQDRPPPDTFEHEALDALKQEPGRPFYRFEEYQGRPVLRYTTADVMRASCLPCHNTHPSSPKKDWQVGDVRGVLEIILPVD